MPTRGRTRDRSLDRRAAREIWDDEAQGWGDEFGCYVFALRRGPGYMPLYVGSTCRTFRDECFTDRNYRLLHEAMGGNVGSLVLFLLAYERTRGRVNQLVVAELEQYLVERAIRRNQELKNSVYSRSTPGFAIPGIHRLRGRPSHSASALRRALGL